MFLVVSSKFNKELPVTTITNSNFHSAIWTCLSTNPVDGSCYSSEYGAMPGWDVSLVTKINGGVRSRYTEIGF